jgi:hypothetical protein
MQAASIVETTLNINSVRRVSELEKFQKQRKSESSGMHCSERIWCNILCAGLACDRQ